MFLNLSLDYWQLLGSKSQEKQAAQFRQMTFTLTYLGQKNKMLITRVHLQRECVRISFCAGMKERALGTTEVGESEPFSGFSSINPNEHSNLGRLLKKIQENFNTMYPVVQSVERKRAAFAGGAQTAPKPFSSISFMEKKLSSVGGQVTNTIILRTLVKTHCNQEEGKNICGIRGISYRGARELSRPHP